MKAQLKILKDFYSPLHKKTLKAGSSIEIDVDEYSVPTHSFWYDQLRFEENKAYFELLDPVSKSDKSKK
jgi:hypothetical protein